MKQLHPACDGRARFRMSVRGLVFDDRVDGQQVPAAAAWKGWLPFTSSFSQCGVGLGLVTGATCERQ